MFGCMYIIAACILPDIIYCFRLKLYLKAVIPIREYVFNQVSNYYNIILVRGCALRNDSLVCCCNRRQVICSIQI